MTAMCNVAGCGELITAPSLRIVPASDQQAGELELQQYMMLGALIQTHMVLTHSGPNGAERANLQDADNAGVQVMLAAQCAARVVAFEHVHLTDPKVIQLHRSDCSKLREMCDALIHQSLLREQGAPDKIETA